ncbi:hypothetical protein N9242_07855 [Vicingaceae bacterium]|nr:hypothetical protein [Vicingaceae bacterium]
MGKIKKYLWIGILVGSSSIFCPNIASQNIAGKLGLEITKAKIGLNFGQYRGRSPETDGPFNEGFTIISQAYFPIQLAADYRKNFTDSNTISNEYNNRVFLIRPSALFHIVDNGSIAMGIGFQFSFLITKEFYLEYQLAGVYLEATKSAAPDLNSGFNLHHTISISKPLCRHFSLNTSFVHMSGAGLGNGAVSNQDVITLGIKWNL